MLNRFERRFQALRRFMTRQGVKRVALRALRQAVHVGNRAVCKRVLIDGVPHIEKTFQATDVGMACFEREAAARQLFEGRSWLPPIVQRGPHWLLMPCYPSKSRLDRVAPNLDDAQRKCVASQCVDIMFEIFCAGYAHRDFHAGNLFLVDDEVRLTDFEVLEPYPDNGRPAFRESYDIAGNGLASPFETKRMCYSADDPYKLSLKHTLGVPVTYGIDRLEERLKDELRRASASFKKGRQRHDCRAGRIYGSFRLPFLTVDEQDAQRNSQRRLARFGIDRETLEDASLLDLGSNVGAMLFEASRFQPRCCVGVEYDRDKVGIASSVAAYNGSNNIRFMEADIDSLNVEALGGPFDVVFCLAIEAHVRKKRRLYRLLSEVTRHRLYFEGNSTTDPAKVEAELRRVGFARVEHIGTSDDDCVSANNRRHLLVAYS